MELFCTHYLRSAYRLALFMCILLTISACRKGPQEQVTVYSNDFQNGDLSNISGGQITSYNNAMVLGRYNKGGFGLQLSQLSRHDLVEISFDLYIHDSWDGNDKSPDGPDTWKLEVEGVDFIRTTFSNKECPYLCFPQSYPFNYLNSNQRPKTDAFKPALPGVCLWADNPRGTSMYKIIKRVRHNGSTFSMRCLDELLQSNVVEQTCDESWSVDNLVIKTIKLD